MGFHLIKGMISQKNAAKKLEKKRDPFTSQRENVSGGNLWCKKYHKTWSFSLLLQYKAL
jgi:hypothetical protein